MYLLFIIIASFFHSISDNLADHFSITRFAGRKPSFWNPEISKTSARKILWIRIDAYTLSNIIGIFLLITGTVLSRKHFFQIQFLSTFWQIVIAITLYIISYNLSTTYYVRRKPKPTSPTEEKNNPV